MAEGKLPKALLAAVVAVALAALGTGLTGAGFTAQTTNPDNTFSAALDFCVDGGTQTLDASADAYVSQLLPTVNFGSNAALLVEVLTLGNKRTLVNFDLPEIPSHCDLTAATLKLYATGFTSGRTIEVYRADGSWGEGTVTWNSAPGTTGAAATTASATGWVSWDVAAQVEAMYSGTNDGFVVRDPGTTSLTGLLQTYESKETLLGNPPELEVTFE
jgi:hypothetical protein